MSMLLALLAQVGPFAAPGPQPVSPLPPEVIEQKARARSSGSVAAGAGETASGKLAECLALTRRDPAAAVDTATAWRGKAKGEGKAQAGLCLGMALSALDDFGDAYAAFIAARDDAPPADGLLRARLGALAGNAALAVREPQAALDALDRAAADGREVADPRLSAGISLDRARALVALGFEAEAAAALTDARTNDPDNADAWLLSATLSRRTGELAAAQEQIERAAQLRPVDPEIGLEAGVIAVLDGREDTARKSWQSVVAAAPDSDAGEKAKGYLAQLENSATPEP